MPFAPSASSPFGTFGALVTLPSPAVSEILSHTGFDWLLYDMEHSPLSLSDVQAHLQAKAPTCHGFVRVPANDPVWIKRVLDLGCAGIIVPQVNSPQEAKQAIAASKYPPEGIRGAGFSRAQGYGMRLQDYVGSANGQIRVILQIEHADAVAGIDAILEVKGIGGVLIGPYDLSGSLNKLGQLEDPEVVQTVHATIRACNRRQVPVGIFTLSSEKAISYLAQGCDFVAVTIDTALLWQRGKEILVAVKQA